MKTGLAAKIKVFRYVFRGRILSYLSGSILLFSVSAPPNLAAGSRVFSRRFLLCFANVVESVL